MHSVSKVILATAVAAGIGAAGFAAAVHAQGAAAPMPPAPPRASVTDPAGPTPDPTHIPYTMPKDMKFSGDPTRQEVANLYGDPNKEGPYAVLYKWHPGAFSRPHFHDKVRWIYVVSGTWWVSSTNVYDEKMTHPMHAGTMLTDMPNTVHWDGNRIGSKEPAVILLAGIGPVKTIQVDEQGKPLPPRPAGAAAPAPAR